MSARESLRLPHSFRAGNGRKVHLGVQRRDKVVVLGCHMSGLAFGLGPWWLHPTDEDVTCANCKRASAQPVKWWWT